MKHKLSMRSRRLQQSHSYLFIFIFTFTAIFSGWQNPRAAFGRQIEIIRDGAAAFSQTSGTTVLRTMNLARPGGDAYLNDKTQNSLIRTASGRILQNTGRSLKKSVSLSTWLFQSIGFIKLLTGILKCFLLFVCLATTYSMRWIICYIHHKNGVKFQNSFC